jgi:hypothetical protein
MPPDNIILRYISVRNLAKSGSPGERDNAQRILTQMREKYPNIEAAVREHEKKSSASGSAGGPREQQWREQEQERQEEEEARSRWEDFLRYGQAFVSGVSGFAQNFGNVVVGRQLAGYVTPSLRVSKANNILLSIKMPPGVLRAAQEDLNPVQLHAFREEMHRLLDGMLDQLFEPMEPEEEEGEEDWEER